MSASFPALKVVLFSEHNVMDFAQIEPAKFDISSKGLNYPSSFIQDGNFLMCAYCKAILRKLQNFASLNYSSF